MTAKRTSPPSAAVHSTDSRNGYVLLVSLVAALGGFLFGFDTAVIAGTTPFLRSFFSLTEASLGWAVSSVLVGCMAGTVLSGRLSDSYGRRLTLILTAILFTVSALATALAASFSFFIMARILGGIAVGTASMIAPVYIAELAPSHLRGRLVSLNQLTIVVGILVAFFSNYLLVDVGPNNWRWMFGVEAGPAALFLLLLFLVPESPRWLAKRGKLESATRVLRKTRGRHDVADELNEILQVLQGGHQGRFSDVFVPRMKPLLIIGIALAFFQQATGINVIMYYAPIIFQKTGAAADTALLQTIAIGAVNLAFTLVAIRFIDRMGRKPLLLLGSAAMGVSLFTLAAAFFLGQATGWWVLLLILVYIASFAASLGPVVWVVNSEIFPTKVRGQAVAVATFVLWLSAFVISLTFPWLLENLEGGYTFLIYAAVCALTFWFVWRYVPETNQKSLEAIEKELVGTDF